MRNKSGIINRSHIFLLVIVAVMIATSVYIVMLLKVDDIQKKVNSGEEISCLINVTDGKELLFSDILIFNPVTGKSAVMDIPINYGSIIKSLKRMDRIDVLYRKDRPDQYLRKIEAETGIEIPFYFDFDIKELAACADLLGGMELLLEDMDYQYLPEGRVVLDGDKVMEYVEMSSRNSTADEMAYSHHKLIQSMIHSLSEQSSYLSGKNVFPVFQKYLDTNMNGESLLSFLREMRKADSDRMIFLKVQGDRRVVDGKVIFFPYYEGMVMRKRLEQTRESLANTGIFEDEDAAGALEILNGTTVGGLAGRTSGNYKKLGYNVKSVRNAVRSDYAHTYVIGHRNNLASVQKVASMIKCKNMVFIDDNPPFLAAEELVIKEKDIILILGKDFDGVYCK